MAANVGPLDPSFGDGGLKDYGFLAVNGEVNDHAFAACPAADGTLVVVGSASTGQRIVTARLLPDGTYDTSFSGDGKESFSLAAADTSTFTPALCQSAAIVAAGHTRDGAGEENLQIVRVLKDTGLPDPAFGVGGVASLDLDTRRSGLGREEVALSVNGLTGGELAVSGYATEPNGSMLAFVALLDATGTVENVAFFPTGRFFTAAIEAPDGRLWLFGENHVRVSRTLVNRQTLVQEDFASVDAPAGAFYWAGTARAVDADTVAMAVVQVSTSDYTKGEPRLAVFHGNAASVLDLPSARLDGSAHFIMQGPLGSAGVTILPGRRVLFGGTARNASAYNGIGQHFAMAHVGRATGQDRVEPAFGASGAQTAALRPDTPACANTPLQQGYARMTLWGGRPVFVGHAYMECVSSPSGNNYLVGRLETNYLFGDGFD